MNRSGISRNLKASLAEYAEAAELNQNLKKA
jgi:hypothetical protein